LEASAIDYEDISDEKLVALTLGGDADAFEQIVTRHKGAVFHSAWRIIGDYHTCEDVSQETFFDAYISLRSLREPELVATWLTGIARRKSLRYVSRKRAYDDIADYAETLPDASSSPEHSVLMSERRTVLANAFTALSDAIRKTAELFYFEELSTSEISRILNIPLGTVKRRLFDARVKLKGELLEMYDEIKTPTLPNNFTATVMERVKKLDTYYIDHNRSMDGYRTELAETIKLAKSLPDEADGKADTLAELAYKDAQLAFDTEQSPRAFELALAAAENLPAGERRNHAIFALYESHIVRQMNINEHSYALELLDTRALPKMHELNMPEQEGALLMWRGQILLDRNEGRARESEENFQTALRLFSIENDYRSVAIAAIKAMGLIENLHPLMRDYAALSESVILKDGVLRFGNQPGFSGGSFDDDGRRFRYIFGDATRYCEFFDLSMKVGDTKEAASRIDNCKCTLTLVSDGETVSVASGTFEHCYHVHYRGSEFGGKDYDSDVWYAPDVGLVKCEVDDGEHREIYELCDYDIAGGEGLMPFAVGNRWRYTEPALPGEIYQYNERVIQRVRHIDNSDEVAAEMSVVLVYGMSADIREDALDSDKYISIAGDLAYNKKCGEAVGYLQKALRVNSAQNASIFALRGIEFLRRMQELLDKGWRQIPCGTHLSSLKQTGGKVEYESGAYYGLRVYRLGTRLSEFRCYGLIGWIDYLRRHLGCIYDEKWVIGYGESRSVSDGELTFEVSDGGTVDVRAGTFANCLKLTLNVTNAAKLADNPFYYMENWAFMHHGKKEWWLAPGIGIVKLRFEWGAIDSEVELTHYELPGSNGKDYFPICIGNEWAYEETKLAAENYIAVREVRIEAGAIGKFALGENHIIVCRRTEDEYEAWRAEIDPPPPSPA
jgi:RNA polymerase sigma-70 factor (ECF subfamily)